MDRNLVRSVLAKCALLFLLAALHTTDASDVEPIADPTTKKPFNSPLSLQSGIISNTEANGLAQLGTAGFTEYIVKQVSGTDPEIYRTFDNSIVVTVNGGTLDPKLLDHIRGLVADRVQQSGFSMTEPSKAQAGIASILSPFRARTGKVTWELLIVVFDRKKYGDQLSSGSDKNGLRLIFESAIRGIVVHVFPETDLDITNGINDQTTLDALRIMFDKAFSNFMQPLSATNSKKPSEPATTKP